MEKRRPSGPWSLVLAGGDGARLQTLTRRIAGSPIPKQYCRLFGRESLLEATLARIAGVSRAERTLVIANRAHLAVAGDQLAALGAARTILQPHNRDTGPGLVLALLEVERCDPRATVLAFPSDHFVANRHAFLDSIARLRRAVLAQPGRLALLGIAPERPDPGLGYIVPGEVLRGPWSSPPALVRGFEEKPSRARAARIIGAGALWSSFVMGFRVARVLELLRAARPDDVARLERCGGDPEAIERAYESLPPWNFSHDFLARQIAHLLVVRADDLGWTDLGTPAAVRRTASSLGIDVCHPPRAELRARA